MRLKCWESFWVLRDISENMKTFQVSRFVSKLRNSSVQKWKISIQLEFFPVSDDMIPSPESEESWTTANGSCAKIVKTMQCNLLSGFGSFSSAMRTSNFFLPLDNNVEHVISLVVEKLSHASEFLSFIEFFCFFRFAEMSEVEHEEQSRWKHAICSCTKNIHRDERSNYKLFWWKRKKSGCAEWNTCDIENFSKESTQPIQYVRNLNIFQNKCRS